MIKQDFLSIAIPIYNETNGVLRLIEETISLPLRKEIIIIDDGSTHPATKQIFENIKRKFPEVTMLQNKKNVGKSTSVQRALAVAKGNIFVILDGDGELSPKDILRLYHALKEKNSNMVTGIRTTSSKKNQLGFSHVITETARKFFGVIVEFFYGKRFNDILSGYKMFYTEDFKNHRFSTKRFGLESDILIAAVNNQKKITEVEIEYTPRGYKQGKKIHFQDGIEILLCLLSHIKFGKTTLHTPFGITCVTLLLWVSTFFFYTLHANSSSTSDSLPNNFTAVNILYNNRIDLTNFNPYFKKRHQKSVEVANRQGVYFAKTPVINGILSVPYFYLFDHSNQIHHVSAFDFLQKNYETYYQSVGKYYASLLTSISVAIAFITLFTLFASYPLALLGAVSFGFTSMVYSTASQGNWQHAPSLLLITLSFYLLLRFLKLRQRNLLVAIAVFCAIASLIRLSNLLFFVSMFGMLLLEKRDRKSLILPTQVFLFIIILWEIITLALGIPGGYNNEILLSIHNFNIIYTLRVMVSLFISPNVGLLVFCPLSVFSFLGMYKLFIQRRHINELSYPLLFFLSVSTISFVLMFLFNSLWWAWEGGFSWGPRLLTEATPFLTYLGIYFATTIKGTILTKVLLILFLVLFIYSFLVHLTGVYANDNQWHSLYYKEGVDRMTMAWQTHPSILWYYLIDRKIFFTQTLVKTNRGLSMQKDYYYIDILHLKWDKLNSLTEFL